MIETLWTNGHVWLHMTLKLNKIIKTSTIQKIISSRVLVMTLALLIQEKQSGQTMNYKHY